MSRQQTTRDRNDILKLDAIPPGHYELNHRQAPILQPLGKAIAIAILSCVMINLFVEPANGIVESLGSFCFCLVGIGAAIVVADLVAGDAIWWMTADFHVPVTTLRRIRAEWKTRWNQGLASPFAKSVLMVLGIAVMTFGSLMLVGYFIPISIGFLYAPIVVVAIGAVGFNRQVSCRRVIWFFRVSLNVAMTKPVHPCVLVQSPHAEIVWIFTELAIILLAVGLATFPWTITTAMPPLIDGTVGMLMTFSQLALRLMGIFVLPLVLFWVTILSIAGPVIEHHYKRLVPPHGTDCEMNRTRQESYDERLRFSSNQLEQKSYFHGIHPELDIPILIDGNQFFEHCHLTGPTGAGKTVLGLMPRIFHHIRRNDSAIVIIDGKGDNALFAAVHAEAKKTGRVFKFLSTVTGKSTYVFNPLDSRILGSMTTAQKVGILQNALGLMHGEDYGRGYFTIVGHTLLRRAFQHETVPGSSGKGSSQRGFSINSFKDLHLAVSRERKDGKAFEAGEQTAFLIEKLSQIEQLNFTEGPDVPADHPALLHSISFPDVIRQKQIIYLNLVGNLDPGPTAEIARLAIYSLMAAAEQHQSDTGQIAPTHVICDEAQMIIGPPISNLLATARSFGISFTLSHQTISQLIKPGGVNLIDAIVGCTATKLCFGARDLMQQKWIRDASGLMRSVDFSYNIEPESAEYDEVDITDATHDEDGRTLLQARESLAPRQNIQNIIEASHDPTVCMTSLEIGRGLGQTIGFYPVRMEWPMSPAEYAQLKTTPWPAPTAETIIVQPNGIVKPQSQPDQIDPMSSPATQELLQKMHRRSKKGST